MFSRHLIFNLYIFVLLFQMSNSNLSATLTNTTNSNLRTTPSSTLAYSYLLRVAFGLIALMAFTGNGLLCAVILRNYRMLRSAYNLLIFSLAFTDMLTGILVPIVISLKSFLVITSHKN